MVSLENKNICLKNQIKLDLIDYYETLINNIDLTLLKRQIDFNNRLIYNGFAAKIRQTLCENIQQLEDYIESFFNINDKDIEWIKRKALKGYYFFIQSLNRKYSDKYQGGMLIWCDFYLEANEKNFLW